MTEILGALKDLPFGGISFAGLVTIAIISIFRGDIVPKSTVDSMRTDRDAMIASKNEEIAMLKEAYRMSEEARITGAEDNKELLEMGRTTVHLLESMHKLARGAEVT